METSTSKSKIEPAYRVEFYMLLSVLGLIGLIMLFLTIRLLHGIQHGK